MRRKSKEGEKSFQLAWDAFVVSPEVFSGCYRKVTGASANRYLS